MTAYSNAQCSMKGRNWRGERGKSKKEAESAAALEALVKMKAEPEKPQ